MRKHKDDQPFITVLPKENMVLVTTGGNDDNAKHFAVAPLVGRYLLGAGAQGPLCYCTSGSEIANRPRLQRPRASLHSAYKSLPAMATASGLNRTSPGRRRSAR